ncbi:beta-1,4-galactosyltransferase galt-1-like [Haliotis cracherodii]|uniref:beta-1,4-galactosyltransferase galt-1-like n=1 Tax=Haliotis cracherodii TaxID=6455 RepID=UPI0039E9A276
MMKKHFFRSMTFKRFLLLLCGVYLCMVLLFHSRLQVDRPISAVVDTEPDKTTTSAIREKIPDVVFNASVEGLKGWVRNYYNVKNLAKEISNLEKMVDKVKGELIINTTPPKVDDNGDLDLGKNCMRKSDDFGVGRFRELERGVYVYSAYLDDRKKQKFIRFIMLVAKDRRYKFTMTCVFGDGTEMSTKPYEMCENHNKQFGGYIYSCPITNGTLCPVKIKTIAGQRLVSVPIVPVAMVTKPYEYGICIPPLFGKIKSDILVEFLELSMLLGAEHFYFYNYSITNEMAEILKHYHSRKLVTLIPWKLPKEVVDKSIWYHGQLLAHNDCMYRSMSTMKHMAINDVDEFIIPHTAAKTWNEFIPGLIGDKHCGVSFSSAFFDPSHGINHPSGLLTMGHTVRSQQFSHVRTKVMVMPRRVFEVGIHHISKQNEERWTPVKSHPDVAYLHHYRRCVSNYGMKCTTTTEDKTVFKYFDKLQANFDKSMTYLEKVLANITTPTPLKMKSKKHI